MSVGGCVFILEPSEQERMMETLNPPSQKKIATQFLTHTIATMLAGLKGQLRLPQLNIIPADRSACSQLGNFTWQFPRRLLVLFPVCNLYLYYV